MLYLYLYSTHRGTALGHANRTVNDNSHHSPRKDYANIAGSLSEFVLRNRLGTSAVNAQQ